MSLFWLAVALINSTTAGQKNAGAEGRNISVQYKLNIPRCRTMAAALHSTYAGKQSIVVLTGSSFKSIGAPITIPGLAENPAYDIAVKRGRIVR